MTHSDAADPPGGLDARITHLREQAEEIQERMTTATATASSPDESVTVTVGAGGALTDVRFGRRAYERSPQQLASLLMQTVGTAQREVSAEVSEAFADLVGGSSTAMSLFEEFRPPEPPPEPNAPMPPPPPPPVAPPPPPRPAPQQRPAPRRPVRELEDEPDWWIEEGRGQ